MKSDEILEKLAERLLSDDFRQNLEKVVNSITEANFKATNKRIDTVQDTVDRAVKQLDDDRKDISDLVVSQKKITAIIEGIRDAIYDQTKRIITNVNKNLQPMPDIVADSIKEAVDSNLENKPKVYIKQKKRKFLFFLRR